jgi:hypothetical protein
MKEIKLGDSFTYIGQQHRDDFTYGKNYKILEFSYLVAVSDVRYWLKDDTFSMRNFSKRSNLIPEFFIPTKELRKQKLKKLKNI